MKNRRTKTVIIGLIAANEEQEIDPLINPLVLFESIVMIMLLFYPAFEA